MISEDTKAFENLRFFTAELKKTVGAEGASFYDAIVDHASDFTEQDFFDGYHLKMRANHRLFKKVDEAFKISLISDPSQI